MMNDLFQEDIIPRRTLGEVLESDIIDRPIIQGGEVSGTTTIDGRRASVVATAINDLGQATSIMDLSVTEAKLANLAVATRAIQDDAITAAKVWKGGSVITLSAQIGTGIIGSAHIGTAQIIDAHIQSLNADKITAGTITGRTVRTATSGTRVELIRGDDPTWPSQIVFFNLHGSDVGHIRGGGDRVIMSGNFLFPTSPVSPMVVWEGPLGFRSLEILETETRARHIVPISHDSHDLGFDTRRWRHLFVSQAIIAGGTIFARGIDLYAVSFNPTFPGQIVNFSSGGINEFRGVPGTGTWMGRFSMEAR